MAITSALRTRLVLIAATALLPSCAGINKTLNSAQDTPSAARAGLPAQVLATGDCAAFVWTADAQKRFVLFSKTDENYALWDGPNGTTRLSHISSSGTRTQNQYPRQDYEGVMLDLRGPQPIENGTRYRSGTLTENQTGEWARVTPVVGVTACQSKD